MANIKSAKKRIDTIDRRTQENKYVKATISTQVKKFRTMLNEGKIEEAEKFSTELYAYIDSACSKGVLHKNNASRKIGRLASALFKAKAEQKVTAKATKAEKVEEVKEVKEEKKTPVKKTATAKKETKATEEKKATAKKTTTAEKTTTKKAATKKAATKEEK